MARLSVKYDNELKKQVFVLMGDEDYARTTKTLLELGNRQDVGNGFNQYITVNVLRDKGVGTIAIYDNDVLLNVIDDWTAQDNARTILLTGLAYNIEHNIVARYMGNTKCSPSTSTVIQLDVTDPNKHEATLTIDNNVQHNPQSAFTKTITVSNEFDANYNINQTIKVYFDDEELDPIVTDDEGTATVSLTADSGLHNIKFVLEESDNLLYAETSQNLSIGYNLELKSSPAVVVYDDTGTFTTKLTDWFNNPIPNSSVNLLIRHINSFDYVVDTGTTDNNGLVSLSGTKFIAYGKFSEGTYPIPLKIRTTINSVSYTCDANITWIVPDKTDLTITPSTPQLYVGEVNTLSIATGYSYANIPVHLTGDIEDTVYTNAEGIATKSIMGTGIGTKQITATSGKLTNSISLNDYIQYWGIGETSTQMDYSIRGDRDKRNVLTFNNYYRILGTTAIESTSWGETMLYFPNINERTELILEGVTTSSNCCITCIDTDLPVRTASFVEAENYRHSNETWRFVWLEDYVVHIYRNGTLYKTIGDADTNMPYVVFATHSKSNYNIDFKKLTIQGL